ncbi:hypothetical protein ACFL2H_10620, partial [Planctomycetota bacterium]
MLNRTLWQSALELQAFLESESFCFCFIGGLAVQRWGQPRTTDDIDLTVVTEFGEERAVAKRMLARYQSRHSDPLQFVAEARILLLTDLAGHDIDLSIGGMPFEHRMLVRSTNWSVPGGGALRTCSAEDLVILKSFAARPQDWIDVE